MDKNVRGFIREYIQQIPNKFMITLKEGDKVRTKLHGKWVEAEVNDIDGSLAQMVFPGDICEWLYRGSIRFEPMEKLKAEIETRFSGILREGLKKKGKFPYGGGQRGSFSTSIF